MAQLVNPNIDSSGRASGEVAGGGSTNPPVVAKIEGPAAEPITPAGQRPRPIVKRSLALAGGLVGLLIALRRRRD